MPLETVHFDSVSGLVRASQNRRLATLFNFTVAGHTEYSVAAPGTPRIEAGMTITAYLNAGGLARSRQWRNRLRQRYGGNHYQRCLATDDPDLCRHRMAAPGGMVGVIIMAAYLAWAIGRIRTLRRARAALAALPLPGCGRAP